MICHLGSAAVARCVCVVLTAPQKCCRQRQHSQQPVLSSSHNLSAAGWSVQPGARGPATPRMPRMHTPELHLGAPELWDRLPGPADAHLRGGEVWWKWSALSFEPQGRAVSAAQLWMAQGGGDPMWGRGRVPPLVPILNRAASL